MNHIDIIRLKNPSKSDYARLAAYIDGEGCIRISRSGELVIRIANTDIRLPMWCKATFSGFTGIHSKGNGKWKPAYFWGITGNAASFILKQCLPYFIIKREQAELAIRSQGVSFNSRGKMREGMHSLNSKGPTQAKI